MKYLKHFLLWCGIIGTRYMAENPKKIEEYVAYLAKLTPGQTWTYAPGYHALTELDLEKKVFFPNKGIPVKVFINNVTGEIRIFPASIFEM